MIFRNFYQHSNTILLRLIVFKSPLKIKVISFFIFLLRVLTLNKSFNLGDSENNLKYSNKYKKRFILDLRNAKLNLHLVGIISQFFIDIKKKYKNFSIITNENTFSLNPIKMYKKEFDDLLLSLKKIIKFKLIKDPKKVKLENSSYIQISKKDGYKLNGKDFNDPKNIQKIFNIYFNLKSFPINFDINKINKKKNFKLYKTLKENFILVFYPTHDVEMKFETNKKRKFGVINKNNFNLLKKVFNQILFKIEKGKISNFKIVLLNKKSLNWPENKNIIDLRNFEKLGLDFSQMLGLLNKTGNWTLGSEGTLQYYLMLSSNLKHTVVVDNSHWKIKNSFGTAVPQFYKGNGIKYKNMPKNFIPIDASQIIKTIFDDYKRFNNK